MFGQPGGGELLLGGGGGGFEGSIGNGGYLSESGGAGGTSAPGANGSNAFNLSDFPSLGGGGGESGNNGLAAALRQQDLLAQQQMMQQGGSGNAKSSNLYRLAMSAGGNGTGANFNMAPEDFPALPGAPPPGSVSGTGSGLLSGGEGTQREVSGSSAGSSASTSSFVTAQPTVSRVNSNGSGVGLYGGGDIDSGSNPVDYNSILGSTSGGMGNIGSVQSSNNPGSSSLPHQQRTASSSTTQTGSGAAGSSSGSGGAGSTGGSSLSGDYGLLGLLGVIRMSDADRNALALGSDLTALGLNLSSSDQLYSTFASPWSESPTTREPQYQLPMCYYMQPPALKTGHLSKFQLETLFYIFYALPKDVLQAYAAQELYSREWRYHVDLKLWFKRASPADGVANSAGSGAQYLYFDINSWERRLFNGNMNQNITSGLLSEDDVRVRVPNS